MTARTVACTWSLNHPILCMLLIDVLACRAGYNDFLCRYIMVYLNPLIALSQLVTCLNREVISHLVTYWLISMSAILMVGGGCCCGCCSMAGCFVERSDTQQQQQQQQQQCQHTCNEDTNNTGQQRSQRASAKNGESGKQQPREENGKRKTSVQHQQQQHSSRQHDREKNDNMSSSPHGSAAHSNGNSCFYASHDECRQQNETPTSQQTQSPGAVCCCAPQGCCIAAVTYNKQDQQQQQQQQGRRKSQHKDEEEEATNRSSNAKYNDDDDYRINSVVRAFKLSQMRSSAGAVHFVDEVAAGGLSANFIRDSINVDSASTLSTDCSPSRPPPRTDWKRLKPVDSDADERRTFSSSEDGALIVSRSSTHGERRQATILGDSVWAPYHEDRCCEYNNSDDSDEQLNERTLK